jgi:hypothetical protein
MLSLFPQPHEQAQTVLSQMTQETAMPGLLSAIASDLTYRTVNDPLPLAVICERYAITDRHAKQVIHDLRAIWLLPIGTTRSVPAGAYWIHTEEEMKAWMREFLAQPKEMFRACYRVARKNFPRLAGQMALNFDEEIKADAA